MFVLFILSVSSSRAQTAPDGYLLAPASSGLTLFAIFDGDMQPVSGVNLADFWFNNDDFWRSIETGDEISERWQILSDEAAVVSPDGEHLALVAARAEYDYALFIISLRTGDRRLIPLDTYSDPVWSPDSTAILLEEVRRITGASSSSLYDLNTDTLLPVSTDTVIQEQHFTWLADSQRFLYSGAPQCDGCDSRGDVYIGYRSGASPVRLTIIHEQVPEDVFPSLCSLTWSAPLQKAVFAVGCTGYNHTPPHREHVYTVDLSGNVELAFDIAETYDGGRLPFALYGLYASSERSVIYGVTDITFPSGTTFDDVWSITAIDGVSYHSEQLYRQVLPHGQGRVMTTSAMAPDELHMAIAGANQTEEESGIIYVVDLQQRTHIVDQSGLSAVCDLTWQRTTTLIYSVAGGLNCFVDPPAIEYFQLDIDTGDAVHLTEALPSPVLYVPIARTPP
jgi:hypothetical protein